MKVNFTYSNGRQRLMSEREAKILQRLRKGTYLTRDMRSEELAFPGTDDTRTIYDVDREIKAANASLAVNQMGDGLDDLDAEQLHEMAKERGVKVHHKAGADKVREALRAAE